MSFRRLSWNGRTSSKVVVVFLFGLVLRGALMLLTVDVPGDGPTRATGAYQTFLVPSLQTYGDWLPGYNYLMLVFYRLWANPLLTPRIIDVVLGSLAVPLFWLLIKLVFDNTTALVSALLLMLLPLHIGLSASSLTESSFVTEYVAGAILLIIAANSDRGLPWQLFVSGLLVGLAAMTRYEGWFLIPIFVLYYYLRTRRLRESVILWLIISIYPAVWTIGNYMHYGDPLWGFTQGTGWFHGAKSVGWLSAFVIILQKSIRHLGWILVGFIAGGFLLQCVDVCLRRCSLDRLFYFLTAVTSGAAIYRLTVVRGTALWDRYLAFGLILMLPFAAIPFTYFAKIRRGVWVHRAVVLLLAVSLAYRPGLYKTLDNYYNDLYVTFWRPTDIINVAAWLKQSSYGNYAVVLTENGGESWYFANYFPAVALRRCVVAWYSEDSVISDYCFKLAQTQKLGDKYLFITSSQDDQVRRRIERFIGTRIGDEDLIRVEGYLRIYDLSRLISGHAKQAAVP